MKLVTVTVDEARCKGCELCIAFCPEGVLELAPGDRFNVLGYRPALVVHPDACTGCAHCGRMCPEGAITVVVETGALPARPGGA